jgi:Rrf2 family protein
MKFSSQEEYGLRCLLRIGKAKTPNGLTIPEISHLEGLSAANVGKLLRILRLGGFIESARGQTGGYKLAHPPEKINVNKVLEVLGGRLYEEGFCEYHAGLEKICTNSIDCSIRSLWSTIQSMLDHVLNRITLADLLGKEETVTLLVENVTESINNYPKSN